MLRFRLPSLNQSLAELSEYVQVLTAPIAFPISYLLDFILGDEVVAYDRKRLMELIKVRRDVDSLVLRANEVEKTIQLVDVDTRERNGGRAEDCRWSDGDQ